jgi:hypothetical protein
MKRHATIFASLALLALAVLPFPEQLTVAGQKRAARRAARNQPPRSTVDYSAFSHATKKHQAACATCHKVPTDNWKKARDFPDVADYPGHEACVSCHRRQFFRSARPAICSVCHTKVSPRDEVRFAFRNPAVPRQFVIEFPHDKHQDVIAALQRPSMSTASLRSVVWQADSLSASSYAHSRSRGGESKAQQSNNLLYNNFAGNGDQTKHYNNCEICHGPRTAAPVAPVTGWVDGFVPDAATFRAMPAGHDACFNCHWKAQQPIRENCAGCHKLSDKPYVAVAAPKRWSLKFRHAREQHTLECTSCHINITRSATLRGLLPDVPITSCSECHNKDGLRLDVSKELEALDKNRVFICSYCHTSEVGRLDPPASHYRIAGREPMRRKDIK